ncbi:hypothetical protein DAERI_020318 [Deinococcus aerius]|uniref:Uncharacterized protein n=1 Tax=Deinococcus aerius TaxID=200253 RepID=A0A2I9DIX5_9DEIO|nr:hypothetical protein [Deinococcus aerius]GBF04721.1 hypothetical protein DAERI_020318 [Deinococcus aerius]
MPTELPVLHAVYQHRLSADATSPLHLVALVTTTDAETAFDLTNHGGRQDTWMNNPGGVPLDLGGRSSGIHDVFVGDQEALLYLGAGTTILALPTRAVHVTVLLALPSRLVWADARVCLLGETTDEALRAELSRPEVARRLLAELEGEPDLPGTPRVIVQGALTQAAKLLCGLRSQSELRARLDALPDHQARVDVMAAALAISGLAAGAETLALARAVVDARHLTSLREAPAADARLETWRFVNLDGLDGRPTLTGRVFDHPEARAGEQVVTDPVEALHGTVARTSSRVYALGEPGDEDAAAHLRTLVRLLEAERDGR